MDSYSGAASSWVVGALCWALVGALPALAQPEGDGPEAEVPDKPPWEWTVEERIAVRTDPALIAQRMKEKRAEARARGEELPEHWEVIQGIEHPELFFPDQLFNALLSLAFNPDREQRLFYRQVYTKRSKSLEIDPSFWRDLSILSAEVLARKHEQLREIQERERESTDEPEVQSAREGQVSQEVRQKQLAACAARRAALEKAREVFGAEAFDRFLYEAVAPSFGIAGSFGPSSASAMRFRTGGCRGDR